MLEGNFNTATTGPTLDQHDTLPFSQERTAGQLSPPTPPTPLSQSMLPCLEDHSSLSVPHATVGPGGRPLHKTLKNGSPRSKLTVYERDGKLQFPLAKGTKIKVGILQEYLKRIPDARKSQSGTVNPLLGVSTLVLSKDEYVDIALAMYPTSKDQQTATRNLRKLWCIFAMTSNSKTSKSGTYTLIFDRARFHKTFFKLMPGGNPSAGRPDVDIIVGEQFFFE